MIQHIEQQGVEGEYFWHDMSPRQSGSADAWAAVLSDHYQKPFLPVRRFYKEVDDCLRGEDYVIAGPADTNAVQDIKETLVAQQGRLVTIGFSYKETETLVEGEVAIGPDPTLARHYDSKFNQYELFRKLGLPVPDFTVVTGNEAARQSLPYYYTAEFSSGGTEAGSINTQLEAEALARKYDDRQIMIIQHLGGRLLAPMVAGIADAHNASHALMVTDQILEGNRYLGNILPSQTSPRQKAEMSAMTRAVGRAIADEGYAGVFCCDFFIDENNETWITDLNPRRFGAYSLMLRQSGVVVAAAELAAYNGEHIPHCPVSPVRTSPPIAEFGLLAPAEGGWRTGRFVFGDHNEGYAGKAETYFAPEYAQSANVIGHAAVQFADTQKTFDDAFVANVRSSALAVLTALEVALLGQS